MPVLAAHGAPVSDLRVMLQKVDALRRQNLPPPGSPFASYAYPSIEAFVLEHGEAFTPQSLPRRYRRGYPKHCYSNAYTLARRHPELAYVEGFGLSVIPMHHAWNVVETTGEVVDSTWQWGRKDPLECVPGALIGVRFPLAVVEARRAAGDEENALLDCWMLRWPLLAERYDPSDPDAAVRAFERAGRHPCGGVR